MKKLTEDEFYEEACKILEEPKVRFASNSPALIIPEERSSFWRQKYFDLLSSRTKNKILKAEYVFSKQKTKELIQASKNKKTLIEGFKEIAKSRGLDLRYTDDVFDSAIIGRDKILLKKEERFLVDIKSAEGKSILENFDKLFSSASKNIDSFIGEVS